MRECASTDCSWPVVGPTFKQYCSSTCREREARRRAFARSHGPARKKSLVLGRRGSVLERFEVKVDRRPDGCWQWLGATHRYGYGIFGVNGRVHRAHRWAYEHWRGPIPEGLELDHLCRNTGCVNPWHLEAVTRAENLRRARAVSPGR